MSLTVNIIVATDVNGVFSADGKIPWHIPEDLQRFRSFTMGKTVIMGRKTFESLGCKPLDGRLNVVLTRGLRRPHWPNQVVVFDSLLKALGFASEIGNGCFVIGGERVYREALPYARNLLLTVVDQITMGANLKRLYWNKPYLKWSRTLLEKGDTFDGNFQLLCRRVEPNFIIERNQEMQFIDIPRYNRGLWKFGPLEECNTGEIMLAKDVATFNTQMKGTLMGLQERNTQLVESLSETRRVKRELEQEVMGLQSELDRISNSANIESQYEAGPPTKALFLVGGVAIGMLTAVAIRLMALGIFQ